MQLKKSLESTWRVSDITYLNIFLPYLVKIYSCGRLLAIHWHFGGASETLDGMVVVGGEKVSKDNGMPGMRDNVASVRNLQDFGMEPVPIMQEEPSINDN